MIAEDAVIDLLQSDSTGTRVKLVPIVIATARGDSSADVTGVCERYGHSARRGDRGRDGEVVSVSTAVVRVSLPSDLTGGVNGNSAPAAERGDTASDELRFEHQWIENSTERWIPYDAAALEALLASMTLRPIALWRDRIVHVAVLPSAPRPAVADPTVHLDRTSLGRPIDRGFGMIRRLHRAE